MNHKQIFSSNLKIKKEELKDIIHFNITERRKYLGLTQIRAAEKLNVKLKTYQAWEEGRAKPDIHMLVKIADIFHIENIPAFLNEKTKKIA